VTPLVTGALGTTPVRDVAVFWATSQLRAWTGVVLVFCFVFPAISALIFGVLDFFFFFFFFCFF
jgi:hypothetical protein